MIFKFLKISFIFFKKPTTSPSFVPHILQGSRRPHFGCVCKLCYRLLLPERETRSDEQWFQGQERSGLLWESGKMAVGRTSIWKPYKTVLSVSNGNLLSRPQKCYQKWRGFKESSLPYSWCRQPASVKISRDHSPPHLFYCSSFVFQKYGLP